MYLVSGRIGPLKKNSKTYTTSMCTSTVQWLYLLWGFFTLWKVLKIQHKMSIYKLRKYYLGKELRCTVSFLRLPQDTSLLRKPVGDRCKFVFVSVHRLRTWQGNHSSHSNLTNYHQLHITFQNVFLREIHGYEAVSEFKKKQKKQQYLLGQGASLHCLVSSLSPGHFSPTNAGGGLVQVRVRLSLPPPQVTEQALHSFQSDQLPSTSNETHMKHYCGCCSNHFAFISHRVDEAVWACYSAKLCLSKK